MKNRLYRKVFLFMFAYMVLAAQVPALPVEAAPVVRTETAAFYGGKPACRVNVRYKVKVSAKSVYKATRGKNSTKNKKTAAKYNRCLKLFRSRVKYR